MNSLAGKLRRKLKALKSTLATRPSFYSPLVDVIDVIRRGDTFWHPDPQDLGIDFHTREQTALLAACAPFLAQYNYPAMGAADAKLDAFYDGNSQFSYLDARMLFALMQLWRPARIIEVGSGYSTLLMEDVNRRLLDGATQITSIEPYPRPFMQRLGKRGITLIEQKVQDVPFDRFTELQAGDVLFIDSSHVVKTGSDVNALIFGVLPRLSAGVRIHFHDVFLPHEYPESWVREGRSWNEQYLVRALLQFGTNHFRMLFSSAYAATCLPDVVAGALGGTPQSGGSLWIEKLSPRQQIQNSSR
ncbi:MAG TPA: class I SAM-dependent methyltransferase [Rhodanobacter sp.]